MRTSLALLAMSALLAVPRSAGADNDATAVRVARRLGYDVGLEDGGTFGRAHAISKIWPADESKTIVAIAVPSSTEEGGYDLDVLVVDSATLAVRVRFTARGSITSDAVAFTGLTIDTAKYRLSRDVRAFGVRLRFLGSSKPNPFEATTLHLFVESGKKLRRVLRSLEVSSSSGEWDLQCAGSFLRTERTVRIGEGVSNGLHDLVIDGHATETTTKVGDDGECVETEAPGAETLTLHYDGKAYRVPARLNFE